MHCLCTQSIEWLQLGVPALLYTLQNNALFIGLSNLEAAIAHVTYQTKILFTALFSICLLRKELGEKPQWPVLHLWAAAALSAECPGPIGIHVL